MSVYHSALKGDLKYPKMSRVERKSCIALRHDLMESESLPDEFSTCDVFYTDLPWADGIQRFNDRAGAGVADYAVFLQRVNCIASRHKPCVLVTGKKSLKHLAGASDVFETSLRGAKAVAAVYGTLDCKVDWSLGSKGILESLATRYLRIGDFCCGYGSAGRAFVGCGKTFVMSDYNEMCIGAIDSWL